MPTVGSWCELDVICSAITALIQWTRPCVGFWLCTPPTGIVPIKAAPNRQITNRIRTHYKKNVVNINHKSKNKSEHASNIYSIWLNYFSFDKSIVCTHDSRLMILMSSLLALGCRRCCCRLRRCCCFRFVLSYRYAVEDSLYDYFHYLLSCYYCLSLCCCY